VSNLSKSWRQTKENWRECGIFAFVSGRLRIFFGSRRLGVIVSELSEIGWPGQGPRDEDQVPRIFWFQLFPKRQPIGGLSPVIPG